VNSAAGMDRSVQGTRQRAPLVRRSRLNSHPPRMAPGPSSAMACPPLQDLDRSSTMTAAVPGDPSPMIRSPGPKDTSLPGRLGARRREAAAPGNGRAASLHLSGWILREPVIVSLELRTGRGGAPDTDGHPAGLWGDGARRSWPSVLVTLVTLSRPGAAQAQEILPLTRSSPVVGVVKWSSRARRSRTWSNHRGPRERGPQAEHHPGLPQARREDGQIAGMEPGLH
jgi:hypothetical protein